jgi:hypothetical protein
LKRKKIMAKAKPDPLVKIVETTGKGRKVVRGGTGVHDADVPKQTW